MFNRLRRWLRQSKEKLLLLATIALAGIALAIQQPLILIGLISTKQTIKFLMFAGILWGGGWLGGMLGGILGVASLGGIAGQAAGFLLSAFVVYWLWNRWGKQAAG